MPIADALLTDLVRRHQDDERACFVMLYPLASDGVRWPPDAQAPWPFQDWPDELRVAWVNRAWHEIYALPRGESPVGWSLARMVGSVENARRLLYGFYSGGGRTVARVLRHRYDGTLVLLEGHYRVIERDGHILGHVGLESDITEQLSRAEDAEA